MAVFLILRNTTETSNVEGCVDKSAESCEAAHTIQTGLGRFFSAKDAPAKKGAESSSTSFSWEEVTKQHEIKRARLLIERNLSDRSSTVENKIGRLSKDAVWLKVL